MNSSDYKDEYTIQDDSIQFLYVFLVILHNNHIVERLTFCTPSVPHTDLLNQ